MQIDTTANPSSDCYPSSPGQLELGKILLSELVQFGLENAKQDQYGVVLATVLGNTPAPTIVLNAHLDTSPETTGAGVKPQIIRNYPGGDIALPGNPDEAITVEENPELNQLVGKTLVTSDGTTLLGADDKAGVAIIMQVAKTLMEHPEIPHGDVRVLFTCDEEIGLGVKHVDVPGLGATCGYTLDGAGRGDIDVETFSGDLATVTVHGSNIHPSIAKDRMVNSIRAMADFLSMLPRDVMSPETTDCRDGFIHPYDFWGSVDQSQVKLILRDFDTNLLIAHAERLRATAREVENRHPGARVQIAITPQYRNLGEGLSKEPRAVLFAEQAFQRLGKPCQRTIVRGGTDGCQFTALGLPTPNLSSGQHNPHSPREFSCLEEMEEATEVVLQLLQVWSAEASVLPVRI